MEPRAFGYSRKTNRVLPWDTITEEGYVDYAWLVHEGETIDIQCHKRQGTSLIFQTESKLPGVKPLEDKWFILHHPGYYVKVLAGMYLQGSPPENKQTLEDVETFLRNRDIFPAPTTRKRARSDAETSWHEIG